MVGFSIRPEGVLETDLVLDGLSVGLLADLPVDLLVNWEHIQPLPTLWLVSSHLSCPDGLRIPWAFIVGKRQ
jgi:hypothetical protein